MYRLLGSHWYGRWKCCPNSCSHGGRLIPRGGCGEDLSSTLAVKMGNYDGLCATCSYIRIDSMVIAKLEGHSHLGLVWCRKIGWCSDDRLILWWGIRIHVFEFQPSCYICSLLLYITDRDSTLIQINLHSISWNPPEPGVEKHHTDRTCWLHAVYTSRFPPRNSSTDSGFYPHSWDR